MNNTRLTKGPHFLQKCCLFPSMTYFLFSILEKKNYLKNVYIQWSWCLRWILHYIVVHITILYFLYFFVIHFFVQITIVQCIICFVIHDLTNLLDSFTIVYVSRKIYIWYWTDMSSFTHRRFFTQKFLRTGTLTRRCPSFYTQELLHTRALQKEACRHRNLYSLFTGKLLRRSFCTEMPLQTEAFTQKILHREAFKQSSFYTHRSFYTENILHREAFSQTSVCGKELWAQTVFTYSSFHTEKPLRGPAFTLRFVFTEQRLCGAPSTQRGLYTERLLRKEVFTHKLYTDKLLHREASTQSILHTQKHLHTQKKIHTHTKALHTRLYTQSFYTQALLRIEACSQSRVYTEQLLHTEAFTQREAFAQSSFYNLIHTETLNTQMPKRLRRQVFTHRGIYTKVLHTDAANSSTHGSFWTQVPFHTEAFTQRCFDI